MSQSEHEQHQREDLLKEHPWGDTGQIVLGILFLVVWIGDSFILHLTTSINTQVPLGVRAAISLVNILAAIYLAVASHRTMLGDVRDEPQVVRTGVYGIVRHPMYLSVILLSLGLLLFSLSLAAAGVWILLIGFMHIIARYEERELVAYFGEDYRNYQEEVKMWLPTVSGRLLDNG